MVRLKFYVLNHLLIIIQPMSHVIFGTNLAYAFTRARIHTHTHTNIHTQTSVHSLSLSHAHTHTHTHSHTPQAAGTGDPPEVGTAKRNDSMPEQHSTDTR